MSNLDSQTLQPTVTFPFHNIVGTCSKCGGPVLEPKMWTLVSYESDNMSAPPRQCFHCGATKQRNPTYGPIIDMEQSHDC